MDKQQQEIERVDSGGDAWDGSEPTQLQVPKPVRITVVEPAEPPPPEPQPVRR